MSDALGDRLIALADDYPHLLMASAVIVSSHDELTLTETADHVSV